MSTIGINPADLQQLVDYTSDMLEIDEDAIRKGPEDMGLTEAEWQESLDRLDQMNTIVRATRVRLWLHEAIENYIEGMLEHEDPDVIDNTTKEQRVLDFALHTKHTTKEV